MPATHKGFKVYEERDLPIGEPGRDLSQTVILRPVGSPLGAVAVDPPWKYPKIEGEIVWVCQSEAEVAALRAFLDERVGRLVPFWLPSFTRDVELTSSIGGASTVIVIRDVNYSDVWPVGPARRHFYLRRMTSIAGSAHYAGGGAYDNGDGTETIDFASPVFPSQFPRVSFMFLVRLAEDDIAIERAGRSFARAAIRFVEVPNEAPT